MNDLYFEKLRNYYSDTKLEENNLDKIDKMLGFYAQIIEFSEISRTKGLLDLEEAAFDLNENYNCEVYLKRLIALIVDGTDPEKVEEVGITLLLSGDFDSFDSIICLMCLRGILLIQEGENPRATADVLRALFPHFVLQTYQYRLNADIENRKKIVLKRMEEIRKKCDESYYGVPYRIRLSEYILQASEKELLDSKGRRVGLCITGTFG